MAELGCFSYQELHGRIGCPSSGAAVPSPFAAYHNAGHKPFLPFQLEGHGADIRDVALTTDGSKIITASADKTARIWCLETMKCLRTLSGHDKGLTHVAIGAGGTRAVTAAEDGTVRVWSIRSGKCLHDLKCPVEHFAVTPDGTQIVTVAEGACRVYDVDAGACVRESRVTNVASLALTADGYKAMVSSLDGTCRVFDVDSGKCLQQFHIRGHSGDLTDVAISEDGSRAVTASKDHTVREWMLQSGVCVREMRLGKPVDRIFLCAHGAKVVTSTRLDNTIRVWDLQSARCVRLLRGDAGDFGSVKVSADGSRAITWSGKACWVRDLEPSRSHPVLQGHPSTSQVAVALDGSKAVIDAPQDSCGVWNVSTGKRLFVVPPGDEDPMEHVTITPDGSRALTTSKKDMACRVWDTDTGRSVHVFSGHTDFLTCTAVSPSGAVAITASRDHACRVWDLESGRCISILFGHQATVNFVVLTDVIAVTASDDNTARVWNLQSGKCNRNLEGHMDRVLHCSLTADGGMAITASRDGTARVWDVQTGKCLKVFSTMNSKMRSAVLTADGAKAVTTTFDNDIAVWDVKSANCDGVIECRRTRDNDVRMAGSHALLRNHITGGGFYLIELVHGEFLMPQLISTGQGRPRDVDWSKVSAEATGPGGRTVAHCLVEQNDADSLAAFLAQQEVPLTARCKFKKGDYNVLGLALHLKRKGCVEAIVRHIGAQTEPQHKEVMCDSWRELTKQYPELLGILFRKAYSPLPDEMLGGMRRASIRRPGGMIVCASCSVGPVDVKDTSMWPRVLRRYQKSESRPVGAYYTGYHNLAGFYWNLCESPLHVIVDTKAVSVMDSAVVRAMVQFKWEAFGRYYYVTSMFTYLLYLFLFNVFVLYVSTAYPHGMASLVYLWMLVGFTVYFLYVEGSEVLHSGVLRYATNPWKYAEVGSYTLALIGLFLRFTQHEHESVYVGISTILFWLKTVAFARGFEGSGTFVKMTFAVLKEVQYFMLLLLLVLIGFSTGMFVMMNPPYLPYAEPVNGYSSALAAFLSLYRAMFGDFDMDDYSGSPTPTGAVFCFIVFLFIVCVLLLNLLIAILTNSYAALHIDAHREFLYERACILKSIEDGMLLRLRKVMRERWFPEFLHFVAAKDDLLESDGADGVPQANEAITREQLREELERVDKRIEDQLAEIRALLLSGKRKLGKVVSKSE